MSGALDRLPRDRLIAAAVAAVARHVPLPKGGCAQCGEDGTGLPCWPWRAHAAYLLGVAAAADPPASEASWVSGTCG